MKRKNEIGSKLFPLQFGITLLTPLLLFLFGSLWLQSRFKLGSWIVIVAMILGAVCMIYQLFMLYYKQEKKNQSKPTKSYNYNHHD